MNTITFGVQIPTACEPATEHPIRSAALPWLTCVAHVQDGELRLIFHSSGRSSPEGTLDGDLSNLLAALGISVSRLTPLALGMLRATLRAAARAGEAELRPGFDQLGY